MKKILDVQGMTCGHCVARVKKIIEKFDGASEAQVELDTKEATFTCEEKTVVDEIIKAINDFGYSATEKG